ncbi:MAG: GerW family sporulation protein [Oscillospiraceae bacterium]|jgi:sporulation protein YtfJ|nr:GerW family sporulation protein [Oscillospiraceae bacterium]
MDKHPIGELMETTMRKIREMIDANTIVGEPIVTSDGVTLIPVSRVTFGFTSGGADFHGKHRAPDAPSSFGGGGGAGVNVIPVAFLVVKGGSVRVLNIAPPVSTTLDRVVDAVPEVIDRIGDFIKERRRDDDDDYDDEDIGDDELDDGADSLD